MNVDQIRAHPAFGERWYYEIELAPGVVSNGREQRSVAQTRELLRRTDIRGKRCLDIGIQEGLVTALMARGGASEALGYDRVLHRDRLELVQTALKVDFDLIGGMKLQDLPRSVTGAFDVVVFSGVLYHMLDPIAGLATVRGLVRNGGMCLIETMVSPEKTDGMYFNTKGHITKWSLWMITPQLLDYIVRFLRLEPLDVVYLGRPNRVAIACRAVGEPAADADDDWMRSDRYDLDLSEYLDWGRVASDAPEIAYDASRPDLVRRGQGEMIDVAASVAATAPLDVPPDQARMNLGATD